MERVVQAELEQALPRAYVAAFRWLGNREESRDACQEAAARVLTAADRYDPARPFYPWFYRILRNLCMDRLKGRRRSVAVADQLQHEPGPRADTAEGRLLVKEQAMAMNRAIAGLKDELEEVIELRHFQDLSYEEMAAIIDCPIGTVMSRLYRARKALREVLHEQQ
jgi:RNA polymerase sigma-70 factor (ECF subfamily)